MSKTLDRRLLLSGLVAAPALAGAAESPPETAVRDTLMSFLKAFENCDLPAMEAAFAGEAVSFDRTVMSVAGAPNLDRNTYRRVAGMPPGMRALATHLPQTVPGPPYQSLVPLDLLIQATNDMAVCTFHLESPHILCRRTIVLQRRDGSWKIIHIHASNVDDTPVTPSMGR